MGPGSAGGLPGLDGIGNVWAMLLLSVVARAFGAMAGRGWIRGRDTHRGWHGDAAAVGEVLTSTFGVIRVGVCLLGQLSVLNVAPMGEAIVAIGTRKILPDRLGDTQGRLAVGRGFHGAMLWSTDARHDELHYREGNLSSFSQPIVNLLQRAVTSLAGRGSGRRVLDAGCLLFVSLGSGGAFLDI